MKKKILMLMILILLPVLIVQAQTCSIQGDVDGSGVVNIVDALLVSQDYVGTVSGNYNSACADVNCNGAVDIVDSLLIAQFYVGIIQNFPCDVTPQPTTTTNTNCEGCGKTLSNLKSGTYNISSGGLSRRFIIRIPDNYDKNKPYRLIFAMHCMGSSDQGVVDSQYYGLLPYSQSSNTPVIFVAPQGYTDSSPWRVNDNKDHIFFADMLKLFKEELCIDTKRVFVCGFSYGAMVSYSLSMDFQDEVRAFATYAPANWNIWLPQRNNKPVAYYQTTGTGDTLCSWVNSDAAKRGGKYCVIQHLEDNGCTVPANIPLANSGTHVLTKFNCNSEYPVWFSSHNGGHTDNARDPGSNVNWVAKETWDFFMQF